LEDEIKKLIDIANRIRISSLKMVHNAGAGHPGGSLSIAEMVAVLYFKEMRIDPKNPGWEDRDRLILSKGHACPALYTALAMKGYFDEKHLMTFDHIDSILQGHPDMRLTPGLDMSAGSLGQGISVGIGMALGARLRKKDFRTYVIIGDGECQEGQIWESALIAPKYKLDNLTVLLDNNEFQLVGRTDEIASIKPIVPKWEAFGWNVITIDGHDVKQIIGAIEEARGVRGKPTLINAMTVKAKGVSFMEAKAKWHYSVPTNDELKQALAELEKKLAELEATGGKN